jgi:Ca2+-binding RTX toxin-like protein
VVDQGKFIYQAWAADGGQYIGGNRLNNTLVAYGSGSTLLGAGGRDSLDGRATTTPNTLIGGTAYGLDSISGALADYDAGQVNSIYRDTDPVPVQTGGLNGPGTADNSQYWVINGAYDANRNSDTLLAGSYGAGNPGDLLDGGAGNDSMVGGTSDDTLYVSNGSSTDLTAVTASDIVIGGGGNDWILFTGSDTYWSGLPGATTTPLGYALSNNGDASGAAGQSISNIKLQDGDPIAMRATGNATSTGNQAGSNLGQELGSNQLVGNEYGNTLNGGGVGGINGRGVGVDRLSGGGGADTFVITGYTGSASNDAAGFSVPTNTVPTYNLTSYATDADYAYIADFDTSDTLDLAFDRSQYLIGSAPTGFSLNNINGGTPTASSTTFGIYYAPGSGTPNLVAVVNCVGGMNLGGNLVNQSFGGIAVDGTNARLGGDALTPGLASGNATGLNYLGFGAMYELNGSDFGNKVI